MKDTKKSKAGNKGRRKGSGQVCPKVQHQAQKEDFGGLAGETKGKLGEPIHPPFPIGPTIQPDAQERVRKLWEHKQGELETRWASAQAHRAEQAARRKRAIKISRSTAAAVLVVLLCTIAWFIQ